MRLKAIWSFLVVVIGAASFTAPAATAGTYPLRACNVPGQPRVGTGPWSFHNVPTTASYDVCSSGGGFGLTFPAGRSMSAHTDARLSLVRPTDGPQSKIGIRQVRLWMTAALQGSGAHLFMLAQTINGPSVTGVDIYGPDGGDARSSPWISPVFADSNSSFHVLLYCSDDAMGAGCVPTEPTPLVVYGAEATLFEDEAPSATVTGGSLFAAPTSGVATMAVEGTDAESGVARLEALLDGAVVATDDLVASGKCSYASWNACPSGESATLQVDTKTVSNGPHTLQLRITDAAGNTAIVGAAQPVTVLNRAASPDAVLKVGQGRRAKTLITRSWRSRTALTGRLQTTRGAPIANATLAVAEVPQVKSPAAIARRTVRTDAKGGFRYVVASRRASRRIHFEYESTSGAIAYKDVRVQVRALPSLTVSLKGTRVRYQGRLITSPIPRRGVRLLLQGRAKGGRWTTFARKRSNGKGRFRGFYRLRAHRPGVRLEFRAVTPRQPNYPFVTGAGRAIRRRVR